MFFTVAKEFESSADSASLFGTTALEKKKVFGHP